MDIHTLTPARQITHSPSEIAPRSGDAMDEALAILLEAGFSFEVIEDEMPLLAA